MTPFAAVTIAQLASALTTDTTLPWSRTPTTGPPGVEWMLSTLAVTVICGSAMVGSAAGLVLVGVSTAGSTFASALAFRGSLGMGAGLLSATVATWVTVGTEAFTRSDKRLKVPLLLTPNTTTPATRVRIQATTLMNGLIRRIW